MRLLHIITALLLFASMAFAEIVGTTKGEFSVNQGTANYTLKIDVPPGVAGMEPELSLNYSSSGGNGYMGLGWSIGGVSSITRCPQTKAVDGDNHKFGVNYNSDDRFCLDGQRLIVVNGLPYGADGAEYRTEIDTYSKIISHGNQGGGPNHFTAKTKSGLTYIYGNGLNSSQRTTEDTGMRWKYWNVSKIVDTYGNAIRFEYIRNHLNGVHSLKKVTYADNAVVYNYDTTRPDKIKGYHGGYPTLIDRRLAEVIVTTDSGSTEVRRYKVAYTNETTGSQRSKVSSVTEQVAEGDLKTLQFTYDVDNAYMTYATQASHTQGATFTYTEHPLYFVDFNNDGFVDQIRKQENYVRFYLGNGKGAFNEVHNKSLGTMSGVEFGDFNSDGLIDILFEVSITYAKNKKVGLILNLGDGKFDNIRYYEWGHTISLQKNSMTPMRPEFYVSDFNGDGLSDVLVSRYYGTNQFDKIPELLIKYSNGDGTFGHKRIINNLEADFDNIKVSDFNGDGLPDIYLLLDGAADKVYINNGNKTFTHKYSLNIKNVSESKNFILMDLNSDGLSDIYIITKSGEQDYVYLNKGNGSFITDTSNSFRASRENLHFADFNGDGYVDLYDINGDSNDDTIWLNNGSGRFTYRIQVDVKRKNYKLNFTDVNGDGMTDIIERDGSRRILFNNAKSVLLKGVTNTKDQDISITYKPMSDSDVYHNYSANGKLNAYPWNDIANDNIEITGSQPLVYTVKSDNGVGDMNTLRYHYGGFVINKVRGSQGFRDIDTYDEDNGYITRTIYRQIIAPNGDEFQFTGMPLASFGGFGATLAEMTNAKLTDTRVAYRSIQRVHNGKTIYEPYTFLNHETIFDPVSHEAIKRVHHYNCLERFDGECADAPVPPPSEAHAGNILKTRDSTADYVNNKSFIKKTYNYYVSGSSDQSGENWIVGRLSSAKVVHSETGKSNVVRNSSFAYDEKGTLIKEVANVDTGMALTKTYVYGGVGNKIKETVSGNGIQTASTTYGYGYGGKFQTRVTNAGGFSEYREYDTRFGTVTKLTGPNELETIWGYDGLGRKTLEQRADGSQTTWRHVWRTGTAFGVKSGIGIYAVEVRTTGKPFQTTFYDKLGREVGAYVLSMDGKNITTRKVYNAKGELIQEDLPHFNGEAYAKVEYTYDDYGRTVKVHKTGSDVGDQISTNSYSNFTVITTNPKGQKKKTVKNAIDQTMSITDAYGSGIGSTITYTYDAAGNLINTLDAKGNITTMKYDASGNKYYMNDPDLGVWEYRYNAAGKITQQWSGTAGADNSKNYTYNGYDILGRVVHTNTYDRKAYIEGGSTVNYNHVTTSYEYAGAAAALGSRGKLVKTTTISKQDGGDWHRQIKSTVYDGEGRPKEETVNISGRGDYTTKITYGSHSRVKTMTYPNGYIVTNNYTNNGYLKSVQGSDGKIHYRVDEMNALGQVENATFGNGIQSTNFYDKTGLLVGITGGSFGEVQRIDYTYDTIGNVLERSDTSIAGKDIVDTFTYDAHNRLKSFTTDSDVIGKYSKSKNYNYDSLGNMTFQYGLGHYTYHDSKPHAVTKIVAASGATRIYEYDAVGNVINRNGDQITYSPANKPIIIKGKNGKEVRFYYGVGGQRYMKTTNEVDTYYIGKSYEEQVRGQEETQICYITIGGKTIGTHTQVLNTDYVPTNENYAETPFNRYFHTDALGSITAITDDDGNVVERRSYEPFGKIRAMDYGINNNQWSNMVAQTTRAYTGHEQVAEISGLVHMNARIYDSDIGRFLSADTYIQDPHDSQSYNRYSYVKNNPMAYTDPTGHFFKKLFKWIGDNIRTIVSIVVAAVLVVATYGAVANVVAGWLGTTYTAGAGFAASSIAGSAITGAIVGAYAGFASGLIMTGSLSGALKGAVFGAVGGAFSGAIGGYFGHGDSGLIQIMKKAGQVGHELMRSVAHGLSRGIISIAQGGKFGAGFASGFSGSFLNPGVTLGGDGAGGFSLRTSIAAIVGGTASALGGGKFSNGAISAAFVHMFNAEGARIMRESKYYDEERIKALKEYHSHEARMQRGEEAVQKLQVYSKPLMAGAVTGIVVVVGSEVLVPLAIANPDKVIGGIMMLDGAFGPMPPNNLFGSIGKGAVEFYDKFIK